MIRNNAVTPNVPNLADEASRYGDAEAEHDLISHIDQTIRHFNERISDMQAKVATLRKARLGLTGETAKKAPASSNDTGTPEDFAPRQRERKGTIAWTVRREAYAVLRLHGRPLNRSELLEALTARGVSIDTADAKKTVSRILWQAPEFEHLDTGYWLKDVPLPSEQS